MKSCMIEGGRRRVLMEEREIEFWIGEREWEREGEIWHTNEGKGDRRWVIRIRGQVGVRIDCHPDFHGSVKSDFSNFESRRPDERHASSGRSKQIGIWKRKRRPDESWASSGRSVQELTDFCPIFGIPVVLTKLSGCPDESSVVRTK